MAKKRDKKSAKGPSRSKSKPATVMSSADEDSKRELFLHHRTAWTGWMAKIKALEKIGDDIKKSLKGDGFTVQEFKIADELATQRGEIKIKAEVSTRLRVARWIGHPMGAQLDLFAKGSATVDPRDEGKQASMENQPRKPPSKYAPNSDGYNAWLEGYAEHQATLSEGFKAPGEGGMPRKEFTESLRKMTDLGPIKAAAEKIGTKEPTHAVSTS